MDLAPSEGVHDLVFRAKSKDESKPFGAIFMYEFMRRK
jgi:hypothetical protein